jgi:hypothetical protein
MCEDHGPSRRTFLRSSAALALGAGLLPGTLGAGNHPRRLPLRSPARLLDASGNTAYGMAMHIHSSFSELYGSMASQLDQATLSNVPVLWWTEHDWRMSGWQYRTADHFETPDKGTGGVWTWAEQKSGPLASGSAGVVASPVSPYDKTAGAGSLAVAAQSSSTDPASCGCLADSAQADLNYEGTLAGLSLQIDALPNAGWVNGYLEVRVTSSLHPATGGNPAGRYTLSYRIGLSSTAGSTTQGTLGIITIPATAATWGTLTLTPQNDIAALWPEVDSRDFALWQLAFYAVSTGDLVSGCFGRLKFTRSNGGSACFTMQQSMMSGLAPLYPAVAQQQGTEVSWKTPHVNWYGPSITLPSYQGVTAAGYPAWVQGTVIPTAHAQGGLVSYNHPYGTKGIPALPQATQDAELQAAATSLLPSRYYGADILEVGYPLRAGVDLAHHAGLWDVASRNAIFLTGNGVSDDHMGLDWAASVNNWITTAWAPSTAQSDLLAALAAGRVYCGSLSAPPVALDMLIDGSVPMGAVSVSSLTSRSLTVTASGLPTGWTLDVLQGAVDYAGTADPTPDTVSIGSLTSADLDGSGQATMTIGTSADSFIRTQVVDQNGVVQALSNPVWPLQNPPPDGIPAPRQA